jgi:N-methylhydantoinase B
MRFMAGAFITVDPITLSVVSGTLSSTVKEMTVIIQRTARSPILAFGNDFSNAVYTTVNGVPEMVIQGQDQPVHLGGMLVSVKSVAEMFGDDLSHGDVIARNEPDTGGSHLIDIDLIQPVFFGDRVVAWSCSRAHMGDIGGPVAGGYNPEAQDLFAEGLVISPIKLVEAGRVREDVFNLFLANVRIPDLMRGDIGAQLSAVRMATRRIEELFGKYGATTVDAAMAELLDRAERLMRVQIAAMPDGIVSGESWIEDDGHGAGETRIGCTIKVREDRMAISIDSPPCCNSYRNSYGGVTVGAVYLGVISGIEPGLPINEGLYRPVDIDLGPRGTMLNAVRPAACAMSTGDVWAHVFDAICDAMSKIVPERACAAWAHIACNNIAGIDPRHGKPYSTGPLHITYHGGAGAVYGHDGGGLWGLITTGGAASVGDIELLEFRLPIHFHRHELRQDSACPGTWRGALGAVMDMEIVDHKAVVALIGDGTKFPPASRLGGGSAQDTVHRFHRKFIRRRDGSCDPFPLHSVLELEAGERIVALIPGGGGVGEPTERDPRLVASDVLAGYVSVESAEEEYGIVIDRTMFPVDTFQTQPVRDAL